MTDVRIERDCLGEMEIPNDQYYGIQTHRMEKVSGTANLPVIFYPDMHYALAQIKKAAAIANGKIGAMPADVSKAIAQACDEMLTGKFNDQFPLDMWQGGGYTCVNMNVNEVIGNRANEILTGHKGTEKVHPNTHVNMGQSTNDTIPSATHLGMIGRVDELIKQLDLLAASLRKKEKNLRTLLKSEELVFRTHCPSLSARNSAATPPLLNVWQEKSDISAPAASKSLWAEAQSAPASVLLPVTKMRFMSN